MGLLPELDTRGYLIEKKNSVPVMKSIQSEKKKYALDWNLLLQDKCPSCGEFWTLKNNVWTCGNHQVPFKIRDFKVAKIKKDLQRRNEMKMPKFEF